MKIIYIGTPDYVIEPLKMLISKHNIVAVITQPAANGLCRFAESKNIPVYKLKNINLEGEELIRNLKPDLMITASFGQMIKKNILDLVPIYNIHPSLLPKYRGATPIQTAVLNGDTVLGVSIIKTEAGMDNGNIYAQQKFEIDLNQKTDELLEYSFKLGGELMLGVLEEFEKGVEKSIKQDETLVSTTRLFKKEDGLVDFNNTAMEIYNKFRAFYPWPGIFCYLNDKILKIWDCKIYNGYEDGLIKTAPLGLISVNNKKIIVSCSKNTFLEVLELQFEGGKRLLAKDFLNGKNIDGMVALGRN